MNPQEPQFLPPTGAEPTDAAASQVLPQMVSPTVSPSVSPTASPSGSTPPPDGKPLKYPYAPYYKSPAPSYSFTAPDAFAPWVAWLIGFLFLRYVLWYADGYATTGFFWLLFAGCACYARAKGFRQTRSHRVQGGILCLFAVSFSLTASPLLHGLCAVFLLVGQAWWMYAVCNGHPHIPRFFAFALKGALLHAMDDFSALPQAIRYTLRNSKSAKAIRTVLLGVLVAVPLTGIVGALLAKADPGVEKLFRILGELLTDNVWNTVLQLGFGFLAGMWFYGMVYAAAHPATHPEPSDTSYEEKLRSLRLIPNLGLYAAVTPICGLYLVYVLSQTTYFLSAFFGELPETMTYAAYARQGFFELCAIAIINLGISLLLTGCAKHGGVEQPRTLKGYCIALCLFTLFILATAFAKMLLYIDAYGLTQLRLYTTWFMVLLAICFLLLLLRQCVRRLPMARIVVTVFVGWFAILCAARPDALIARYNIARYEAGSLPDLDVGMLCTLSDDAYVVMMDHWDCISQTNGAVMFQQALTKRLYTYTVDPDTGWNDAAWRLKRCQDPELLTVS